MAKINLCKQSKVLKETLLWTQMFSSLAVQETFVVVANLASSTQRNVIEKR